VLGEGATGDGGGLQVKEKREELINMRNKAIFKIMLS